MICRSHDQGCQAISGRQGKGGSSCSVLRPIASFFSNEAPIGRTAANIEDTAAQMRTCLLLVAVTACASSKREGVWQGRAPVRLRGGGAVFSQLGNAPALEAELGAARAALDASQKAARKARREARRREASLQLELDALEAVRHADAPREPGPLALGDGPLAPLALGDAATEVSAAVGVLAHDQATSLAAPEASPPPAQSGVTRAFRLLNSAVLLACALGLAAAPFRSIGLLLQIDLSVCPA